MPKFFIVFGLIVIVSGAWTAGDQRVVCRASSSSAARGGPPSADCTIVTRAWLGHHVSLELSAREVEEFRVDVDRRTASDPNDPPDVTYSLVLRTHDGSQYRVASHADEAELGAGRGWLWLSNGMRGDFVFVSDAFGRGLLAAILGGGCILGGFLGLWLGRRKARR